MSRKHHISVGYVCQALRYQDGKVFWIRRPRDHFKDDSKWKMWNTKYSCKEAGCVHKNKTGRLTWQIHVNYVLYSRHIIVWVLCNKEWPQSEDVDHKNRNPLDDHIENLRLATHSDNRANTFLTSRNKSGFKGVHWAKANGKWCSQITIDSKSMHLGYFDDPEEAHHVYMETVRRRRGEFAYDGVS